MHAALEAPYVGSEVDPLRAVMVHRPGPEIARITPENKEALLFDDLLWLERAQQEHDRFTGILRDRGVEVLEFTDLLADCLDEPELRGEVVDRIITPAAVGPRVAGHLRRALREAPTGQVVEVLVAGLLQSELAEWGVDPLFADLVADPYHYVLRPLPNLLFMRDNAAWIDEGLLVGVLATPARAAEALLVRTIYDHHPRFAQVPFPCWYGGDPDERYPATIEGGDVLVLDDRVLLVGMGERTTPAAVEMLARNLFAAERVDRILAVHLPKRRAVMHLDTVFTVVDDHVFNVFPGIIDEVVVHVVTPGPRGLRVERAGGLRAALVAALGRDDLVFVPTGGDAIGRIREQWDDGNNTLAVAPGVVVAYLRNQMTNRRLREAGIEVIELDASELGRGRGGTRCMTQPIRRARRA
ncbi:MAG TPA: arginine deiminase [Actinobacteria bacterium]|nr:arginine deiminase [Actinomycetota bacterium]